VELVFFSSDPKERGWKVVLQKDPHRRHITETIQIDAMKFDRFQLDNIDDYTGLQAFISIKDFIQLATIVGNSNVTPLDFNLVIHERKMMEHIVQRNLQQVVIVMVN
jgi:hypothetical protein